MTLTDNTRARTFEAVATQNLEGRLLGEVIRPSDEAYDAARGVWNTAYSRFPGLIVRTADAADVLRVVEFARERQAGIAVRSGGHSFAGYGTLDGGVVIDLGSMKGVSVDPQRRTAWVQPGATTADIGPVALRHGLALPTGDVASVGIGGLTLGGGIGWLVRKYGLTIDHLRSIEMVTADGRLITASHTENSDLFWAVRGGGGNFGVVTAFEFNLVPVNMILGGALVLPATREVVQRYVNAAAEAPEALTTIAALLTAPPAPFIPAEHHGKPVLIVFVCYDGSPSEGMQALAPIKGSTEPIAEVLMPMPYPALYDFTAEGAKRSASMTRSGFFRQLDGDLVGKMVAAAADARGPHTMIQIRPLGGAMSRVASGATAFAHRDARYMVSVIAGWESGDDAPAAREWVLQNWAGMRPAARGVYVNFLGDEGAARIREAYPGATYERLVAIKRKYDPMNLFRLNQNINPAT